MLVRHRVLEEALERLARDGLGPRCELRHALLRHRALDERRHILVAKAERAQAERHVEPLHQREHALGEHRARMLTVVRAHSRDVRAERLRGRAVALGAGWPRHAEHGGGGHRDAHPVRDDRRADVLVPRLCVPHVRQPLVEAGDGVRHAVREVHPRVAKADACTRGRDSHRLLRARLATDGALKGLGDRAEGGEGPDVRDRVAPLVRRPQLRPRRRGRALVVGQRRERFERVAQHVEA
mmetsp:Transcript_19368/g.49963  ORF Transcript_19368/g.49963 Transcript_19368/m.49963 type:complete len:239 (-) Transcript_19368:682-1398(-)